MKADLDLHALAVELASIGETAALGESEGWRWAIHGARPRLVCAPTTAEAMAAALECCDRAGAAVIPRGGGTQQRLGCRPGRADVVLATHQLSRLVEYEPADLTATVEAGLRLSDFQNLLGKHDQWLALDPPLKPGATVGGMVATNATGPRRIREGGVRDLVIGTRVANVDGAVTRAGGRVVKNVTGYDLNKLHVGALGSLGILVEVAFKVAPRPEAERTWYGVFRKATAAAEAVTGLSRLPLAPTALDLLNDRAAESLGLPVPPGGWVLLARAAGFERAIKRHMAEFDAAARAGGALAAQMLSDEASGATWAAYREMAAHLRWSAGPLTCRLAVPPAALGAVSAGAGRVGTRPTVWAHGTGAVFWGRAEVESLDEVAAISTLRTLAEGCGGALIVENWPPGLEGVDVWGAPGPLAVMRAIKQQYDSKGTLNPGRFVGGI